MGINPLLKITSNRCTVFSCLSDISSQSYFCRILDVCLILSHILLHEKVFWPRFSVDFGCVCLLNLCNTGQWKLSFILLHWILCGYSLPLYSTWKWGWCVCVWEREAVAPQQTQTSLFGYRMEKEHKDEDFVSKATLTAWEQRTDWKHNLFH